MTTSSSGPFRACFGGLAGPASAPRHGGARKQLKA